MAAASKTRPVMGRVPSWVASGIDNAVIERLLELGSFLRVVVGLQATIRLPEFTIAATAADGCPE